MQHIRAMGLMILAMAGFAIGDAGIRSLAGALPSSQIILIFGLGGTLILTTIALVRGVPLTAPGFWHPAVLLRNGVEVFAAVAVVTALSLAPLSTVTAIMQAVPLLVTGGAALFLGERVGPLRWSGVGIGLIGVLLMLRPSETAPFQGILLAFIGTIALAVRDLTTRRAPKDIKTLQLATWGFAALLLGGSILTGFSREMVTPNLVQSLILLGIIFAAVIAYFALTTATRMADASLLSPFRYTRLPFAILLGYFLFGERLDGLTVLGLVIVVGSGLFVAWRERRLA